MKWVLNDAGAICSQVVCNIAIVIVLKVCLTQEKSDIILKSVIPKGALCSSGEDILTRRGTSSLNDLHYLLFNIIIQIWGISSPKVHSVPLSQPF